MLTIETIQQLANKLQTTEANIRQEYVQHLFLSYFYQQPQASEVYFKGGTALRLLYKSPRFSEDLDFSATLYEINPLEDAIQNSLKEIERVGIKTEIREAKKTTGGYLAILLFQIGGDNVTLQFEVSLRQGDKKGEVATVTNDFIPSYTVLGLMREQLVDEKIQALLTRKKPRDFYDLYFLLRAGLLPPEKKNILPQALKDLSQTDINFPDFCKLV